MERRWVLSLQREGRIIRQGNMNSEVNIYRYVTKNTFDAYLWNIVEQKQRFITQIMTSKSVARNCEDIDETVLSFAEVKALATGNPMIKEKMDIDNDISRLRVLKSAYDSKKYTMEDNFTYKYPKLIEEAKEKIKAITEDIKNRDLSKSEEFSIVINGITFDEREKAGLMLQSIYEKVPKEGELKVGTIGAFDLLLKRKNFYETYELIIKGQLRYSIELGDSPHGNMLRIEHTLSNLESRVEKLKEKVLEHERNLEQSKVEFEKPFQYEEDLKIKLARQFELNALLDMDKKDDEVIMDDDVVKQQEENISEVYDELELA